MVSIQQYYCLSQPLLFIIQYICYNYSPTVNIFAGSCSKPQDKSLFWWGFLSSFLVISADFWLKTDKQFMLNNWDSGFLFVLIFLWRKAAGCETSPSELILEYLWAAASEEEQFVVFKRLKCVFAGEEEEGDVWERGWGVKVGGGHVLALAVAG